MHSNHGVFVDEVVEQGIDGESGDALDAGLAHDVLAMGGDGEHAHVEACSNLFVRQAFGDLNEDCRLAAGELVVAHGSIAALRFGAYLKHRL